MRIVLVSADFGREITTAVLWLNGFEGMDIRCVRLVPYELDSQVYVDIQQVIPLPEAADYQVKVRRKEAERERAQTSGRDFTRYQIVVEGQPLADQNKRNAIRVMIQQLVERGVSLEAIQNTMPASKMRVLEGTFAGGDSVSSALKSAYPGIDLPRWFVDDPFVDASNNRTYVLRRCGAPRQSSALRCSPPRSPRPGSRSDAPQPLEESAS